MASRESYRDRAFVVRTYDFGEADRVVVLLTRHHGLVRSVAKGVRKSRSRFGSRIQPFVDIDVQLYPGRNLATITAADTVAYFAGRIIEDFDRYAAGCAALEAAPYGVRINAVSPSIAKHAFLAKVTSEELLDKLSSDEAFGRAAEPWEVAATIAMLASDYTTYLTGEVVSISSQRA